MGCHIFVQPIKNAVDLRGKPARGKSSVNKVLRPLGCLLVDWQTQTRVSSEVEDLESGVEFNSA